MRAHITLCDVVCAVKGKSAVPEIAAEDDAIASHTVVRLPVGSYHQRLEKLAQGARSALAALSSDAQPAAQVQVCPFRRCHNVQLL